MLGALGRIGLPPVPLSIKLSQVILMNMKYRLSQTGKSLGPMCAHRDTEEPRSLKSLAVVFVSISKHKQKLSIACWLPSMGGLQVSSPILLAKKKVKQSRLLTFPTILAVFGFILTCGASFSA